MSAGELGVLTQSLDLALLALAQLELDEVEQVGLERPAFALGRSRDLVVMSGEGRQLERPQQHPQGGFAHDATSSLSSPS
ncbi:MAG: hypothetical protein QM765_20905 [Myxococcales bacterium]